MSVQILTATFWADWPYASDTTFEVRAVASRAWVSEDQEVIPAGMSRVVGTGTITALRPTLPTITLPSTTAGLDDQTARWTVTLHRTGNKQPVHTVLADFPLPDSFEPTITWASVSIHKNGHQPLRDTSVYTKSETDYQIQLRVGQLNKAGVSPDYGLTALSIAPASASDPIAVGANTLITATAPVRIDGGASANLSTNRTLSVNTFGSGAAGVVPASGGGTTNFLRADGTWAAPIGGVTTVFGRSGAVVAAQDDYTWAQINKATSSLADITTRSATDLTSGTLPDARFPATLPALNGSALTDLNATNLSSGTVAAGRMPALTGDVTTSAGAVATTIAADAVTYAKMQNVSAASKLLGRGDGGAGDVQELTLGTGLTMSGTTLNSSGTVSGSGTLNTIPRITNATGPVYGDSALSDDGTSVSSTRQVQVLTTATNLMRFTRDASGNSKWLQTLLRPAAPTAALIVDGTGNVTAGAHTFKMTYVTPAGETDASVVSNSVTADGTHTKITLTLPTNNTATGYNTVATGRNIYASKVGDPNTWFRVAASPVVANNLDTTYEFNIADASFSATQAPTTNTAIDARVSIDNLGNVGIGTASPQFTDDGQGKSFVVEAGTAAAGYIGAGTSNMADVTGIVGLLAFYNLAMGGVDHRVAHIAGYNDGALGRGRLSFSTAPDNIGCIERIRIAYDGSIRMGNPAVAGGTLGVTALDAGQTFIQGWYDWTGTNIGSVTNAGNFLIGTATPPTANATKLLVFGDNGATDPTMGNNTAAIYAKDDGGTVKLYSISEGGVVTPLTMPYGAGVVTFLTTPSSANLASAVTGETGSGALVFGTTPTLSQPNIVGTTTNDNAAAGSVGEVISSSVASGSAVSLTTATAANVTSISLTAGDWDVTTHAYFLTGTGTNVTLLNSSVSSTSATLDLTAGKWSQLSYGSAGIAMANGVSISGVDVSNVRVSIAATTTIYFVARGSFTVSTLAVWGAITARRVR